MQKGARYENLIRITHFVTLSIYVRIGHAVMKIVALAICALVCLTASSPPKPPPILDRYIHSDDFSISDLEWMRGAFPEASQSEKIEYNSVDDWLKECSVAARAEISNDLQAMGIENPKLDLTSHSYPICDQFASKPMLGAFANFEDFSKAVASTRPIFQTLVATTDLAEMIAGPTTTSLADELMHRPMSEQIYRNAISWTQLSKPVEGIPTLTAQQKPVLLAMLISEIRKRDRANTAWMKQIISLHGWPTFSLVGEDASRKAWLIVQHADHDPVFQLKVLRLMEPLARQNEVSPKDYAYLYDRVILKISGMQRYATQVTCAAGKRIPMPLADEEKMPDYRRSAGLEPFEEYLNQFPYSCPPD